MTIYIDPPLWPAHGTQFSHLISDVSLEELHTFADHAGLSRRAFDRDHYDVPAHRHRGLVSLGAVPVSGRELTRILSGCGLRVRSVERAEKVRWRLELAWQRLGARLGVLPAAGKDDDAPAHGGRTGHLPAEPGGTGLRTDGLGKARPVRTAREWQVLGAELLDRWSEPHRHYHSMTHLASVLSAVASLHRAGELQGAGELQRAGELQGSEGQGAELQGSELQGSAGRQIAEALRVRHTEPAEFGGAGMRSGILHPTAPVLLAAWFHDAVYAGEAGADEEASAVLAEDRLGPLLPEPAVAETARLVRLTASHAPVEQDRSGAVLTDADLEVLARPPHSYRRYTEQVRADYAHVPDEDFAAGRAAVLDGLLERPTLYRTVTGRRRWETAARRNLRAEAQSLRSGRLGPDFG